jgi:hypothetical protein
MTPTLHRCTSCRERKPQDQFYGSHRAKCKQCLLEAAHERRVKKRTRKPLQRVLQPSSTQDTPKPAKAPQKRTVGQRKPARRTRIRAVSEKKREWNDLYRRKYEKDTLFGVVYDLGWDGGQPVVLRKLGSRAGYERHHPAARARYHILAYVYVSHALHEWCHGNGKAARAIGALLPEFDGRESGPGQLDPFSALPQIQELKQKYT